MEQVRLGKDVPGLSIEKVGCFQIKNDVLYSQLFYELGALQSCPQDLWTGALLERQWQDVGDSVERSAVKELGR